MGFLIVNESHKKKCRHTSIKRLQLLPIQEIIINIHWIRIRIPFIVSMCAFGFAKRFIFDSQEFIIVFVRRSVEIN